MHGSIPNQDNPAFKIKIINLTFAKALFEEAAKVANVFPWLDPSKLKIECWFKLLSIFFLAASFSSSKTPTSPLCFCLWLCQYEICKWREKYKRKAVLIAFSFAREADWANTISLNPFGAVGITFSLMREISWKGGYKEREGCWSKYLAKKPFLIACLLNIFLWCYFEKKRMIVSKRKGVELSIEIKYNVCITILDEGSLAVLIINIIIDLQH